MNKQLLCCALLLCTYGASAQIVYSYAVPSDGYAPNGNVVKFTDSVTGNWALQYDPLSRLTSAIIDSSTGQFRGLNLQWTYDSFGNRLSQTVSGSSSAATTPVPSLTFGADNRIASVSTGLAPAYDGSGNVTFDGASTYALYDAENRICATYSTIGSSGITQYLYNAEGVRVAKGHPLNNPNNVLFCPTDRSNFAVTATYVLGLGGEQVTERDGSGNWRHSNVYSDGKLLATYDSTGVHFALSDPLGTVRVRALGTGAAEHTYASLPFGDSLTPVHQDVSEHHFTGKERDQESGLDYFGARYYGSNMGRFMSPDPLGGHLEDPQTLNRYVYVRNNPLSLTDPTGLDFALSCTQTKGNSSTCQSQQAGTDKKGNAVNAFVQGTTDSNGKFTSTQIGDNGKGGLVDKTTGTGSYSALVSGSGVQFSQNGGSSSGGVFVNGTDPTHIQGSGDLSGFAFTFINSKLEANQTAAGTFTFGGSLDGARTAMGRAGFMYFAIGTNFGFDAYRSRGSSPDGSNAGHFNIDRYRTEPRNGVPQITGNMHFGEHNPLFSPLIHAGEAQQ